MSVELNHTIVWATDREVSAEFLAGILGLPVGPVAGPFRQLRVANGVTLDFATAEGGDGVRGQHYAPGEINHESGGRGVYFADPDGHNLELLTRACGD
jgi:hypothetical protein